MKSYILLFLICFLCNINFAFSQDEDRIKKIPAEFVQLMNDKQFDKAVSHFDSTVGSKLNAEDLASIWDNITEFYGDFLKLDETKVVSRPPHFITNTTCYFGESVFDVKLVFDSNEKIAGIFFLPPSRQNASYIDTSLLTEQEVKVGAYKLPGLLSIPAKGSNFPLVVLVHGSGPNDMDETIGPNAPFRDLAYGLAAKGIAVLRYDKRTYAVQDMNMLESTNFTVMQETVEDALAAVQLGRSFEKIDSSRIFLLGHSLGAMMAPRIGEADARIAGLIMMAGPARKMEDVLLDQYNYILGLDGISEKDKKFLKEIETRVKNVKSRKLSIKVPASDLPLEIPAAYWMDLNKYDQLASAKKFPGRILVLQGERDYQITMQDFRLWKENLSGAKRSFISYPELNHLFLAGKGKSQPNEYGSKGNIPEYVIDDIAAWVLK